MLDPNNYRFIDSPSYQPVPDDKVEDSQIQRRTLNLLVGKNRENITDLIDSMKRNGFIPVDQIQVKELPSGNLLVLEGNRRIATLKILFDEFKEGNDVGRLTEASFKSVEMVLNPNEDEAQHLIIMGLKHINGNRKWKAVNQAQLIHDLMTKHGKFEEEVCGSLGITKQTLRRARRTLALINRYKESDYGDQFTSSMYSIFEEMVTKTAFKQWFDWSDEELRPQNLTNEERAFSWVSREEITEEDDSGEKLTIIREPIITKYTHVREISKFIQDEKALEHMEKSRSITEGYTFSETVAESKFKNALSNLQTNTQVLFNFSEFMGQDEVEAIVNVKDKISRLIPENVGRISHKGEPRVQNLFNLVDKHFSALEIGHFNRLDTLQLKQINRINIIAGINNSGKTSLLEAIYSITQLNNIRAFLDLLQFRGKFYSGLNARWLIEHFTSPLEISGIFNNSKVSWSMSLFETKEEIDKTDYLGSFSMESEVKENTFESTINLFQGNDSELFYSETFALCKSAFTSPYRHNYRLLRLAHSFAVREKLIGEVINFLQQNVDDKIQDIELVEVAGESRFYVSAKGFDKSVDITQYGEGVQRIFEIALLAVYCNHGILCIDEFESAIHKTLLIDFTMFLQKLAERFNVQVFLSTHSKECIDAFVENDFNNQDITAYVLRENFDGKIVCKFIEGIRLERLVENLDIDIRA